MDYKKIEDLASEAKAGNNLAKEELSKEFTPLILNLSKNSFINSYEFEDIKNECYGTLFKCVNLYDSDKHRFVAYATNAIKNSVNNLIRTSIRRTKAEGPEALVLNDNLEHVLSTDPYEIEEYICNRLYSDELKNAMRYLTESEKELIEFIYFREGTLMRYSKFKHIPYSTVVNRKNVILAKLKDMLCNKNRRYLN